MAEATEDATPDYVEPVPPTPSLNDAVAGDDPPDGFTIHDGDPGPTGSQPELAVYPKAGAARDAAGVTDALTPDAATGPALSEPAAETEEILAAPGATSEES